MPKDKLFHNFSRNANAILILALLALYLSMASGDLTGNAYGADGGDLLTAMLVSGVPHPTGYPTYTLLGKLFQLIPVGTPYLRASLLSMVAAVLAVGLMASWYQLLGAEEGEDKNRGMLIGALSGLVVGVAPLFWGHAVIVEVYALQALFIVLALYWSSLLLKYQVLQPGDALLYGLAFAFGAGFGNHITLVLIVPIVALAVWRASKQGLARRIFVGQFFFGLLGLCVYIYLPLAASRHPAVNWGNPQTWDGFVWEVSGQAYGQLAFGIPPAMIQQRLFAWASLLKEQFGVAGLLLGVVGAVQFPPKNRFMQGALIWVFAVYSIFAIGYNTADSVAYLIPALIALVVWIGRGIEGLWQLGTQKIPWGKFAVVVGMLLILARVPGNYSVVDPRNDVRPARFAEHYLETIPSDAILAPESDQDIFPLWYYHFGLGIRPDVRIVVPALTQFTWYRQNLMHTYPDLDYPAIDVEPSAAWQAALVQLNTSRPVCLSWADESSTYGIEFQCQAE
ncbi:MAG: DUF2723 domain-containing protein [Anaerolineales bacterium]|nr:DUF2723 domain-containing protein [Anaerolineales bacterium]